ncbi:hypothetical protein MNBD_GAMMA13-1537 [hydrothermal vent metagenome]|uniref:histidine kinase n=1 Tax=hydrothermal vent metagenome TaxID=652676 RepID=A0A3B0YWS9_9ZZZZ
MNSLQCQITAEQLKAVYKQLPSIVSAAVGAVILTYILKDVSSPGLLSAWLGMVFLNCIAAGILYLHYINHRKEGLTHPHWRVYFTVFTFCTGIIWGVIGILFYSTIVEIKLLIVVWIWAMGAGMTTLLVAYQPAFYAMIIPLFLPLTASLAIDDDIFYHSLAAATFAWMLSLMYFYYNNHKTFLDAITLKFINTELVADLARKNQEAENANLAKSQFLAAASHDLRQPLHAQCLFLAELDQYVDSPAGRRILGGLESSVYAMRKLLNAILDLSSLEAGTTTPSKHVFPISTVFTHLKSDFETLAEEKGIALRICECSLLINTDPVLLERILRNLISNAIRYTREGKVLIGCRRHTHSVSIQILDTGIGIPKDKQKDIFVPFIQLGNPERDREKGLGLGLSIVKRTSELLEHMLIFKSTQGKGTTVSLDVPLADTIPNDIRKTRLEDNAVDLVGKRILIIDDDTDVRTAIFGLLRSWECIPLVFPDISSALEHIGKESEDIDIILSDFNLPGNFNGIQAIEMLRAQCESTTPAALITGNISVNKLREAEGAGLSTIHKPVLASELRSHISKLAGYERCNS